MFSCISANVLETLGLGWQKILLYLANFAVLCVGLTFLLYKPIKKFMAKRKAEIEGEYAAAAKAKDDVDEYKKECDRKVTEAQDEAKARTLETKQAKEDVLRERDEILETARKDAEAISAEAKDKADEERKHAIIEARGEVVDLAVKLASDILEREISADDNKKIIDESIKEWTND